MPGLLTDTSGTGRYKINSINGEDSIRLMEMGVLPGLIIDVVRRAPTGYPIEIKVRGYLLTLREQEAKCIEVEVV